MGAFCVGNPLAANFLRSGPTTGNLWELSQVVRLKRAVQEFSWQEGSAHLPGPGGCRWMQSVPPSPLAARHTALLLDLEIPRLRACNRCCQLTSVMG